MHTNRRDAI